MKLEPFECPDCHVRRPEDEHLPGCPFNGLDFGDEGIEEDDVRHPGITGDAIADRTGRTSEEQWERDQEARDREDEKRRDEKDSLRGEKPPVATQPRESGTKIANSEDVTAADRNAPDADSTNPDKARARRQSRQTTAADKPRASAKERAKSEDASPKQTSSKE